MKRLVFRAVKGGRDSSLLKPCIKKEHQQSIIMMNGSNSKRTFFDFSEDDLKKMNKATNKPEVKGDELKKPDEHPTSLNSSHLAHSEGSESKMVVPKKRSMAVNPHEPLYGECLNFKAQNNLIDFSGERREDVNKVMNILSNVESHNNIILG